MIPTEDHILISIFSTYNVHENKNIQKILTHQGIKSLIVGKNHEIFTIQVSTRDDFLKGVASKFQSKVKPCAGLVNK